MAEGAGAEGARVTTCPLAAEAACKSSESDFAWASGSPPVFPDAAVRAAALVVVRAASAAAAAAAVGPGESAGSGRRWVGAALQSMPGGVGEVAGRTADPAPPPPNQRRRRAVVLRAVPLDSGLEAGTVRNAGGTGH
jgi:hypothetical protein